MSGEQASSGNPEQDAEAVQKPDFEQISARKVNLIVAFLEANGTLEKMQENIDEILEKVPEISKERLSNLFNMKDMAAKLVPIYSEYYTDQELEILINFYQSPVGKKNMQKNPEILEKTMKAYAGYFQEKVQSMTSPAN